MKRYVVLLFVLIPFYLNVSATSICDLIKAEEVTWYGVDFTMAKFIGPGFNDEKTIVNDYLYKWNALVLLEPSKYRLDLFFNKKKVNTNLTYITSKNKKVLADSLFSMVLDNNKINEDRLKAEVLKIETENNEGIGVVLFVESFNKITANGTFYLVFFDKSSKEIIYLQNKSGEAAGFGFRNYWANSIFTVLKSTRNDWKVLANKECI